MDLDNPVKRIPVNYGAPADPIRGTMWDKVRECIGRKCPFYTSCPYRAQVDSRLKFYVDPEEYECPKYYKQFVDYLGDRFNPDWHLVDLKTMKPLLKNDPKSGRRLLVRRNPNQPNTLGTCIVEARYIRQVSQPLIRLMEQANDPFINQLIGLHLVPRYIDLLHLKMERLAHSHEVLVKDGRSGIKINPLFRETRAASDAILRLWKTTGLEKVARQVGFFKLGGKILPEEDDLEIQFERGAPDAYDEMAGDA